jgi:hypothetical protein
MGETAMKEYMTAAIIFSALWVLSAGCSGLKSYGKLVPQEGLEEKTTIETLEAYWEDYRVSYAGCCGDFPIRHPSGIMFDPLWDDRALVGDRWAKVENERTLSRLIRSVQKQANLGGYYPKVWKIVGEDEQFYGYLFSSEGHVTLKPVEKGTMYVYDLPYPRLLRDGFSAPGGGMGVGF